MIWSLGFLSALLQMAMRDSEISIDSQNVARYFVEGFAIDHRGKALISARSLPGFVSVALAKDFGVAWSILEFSAI